MDALNNIKLKVLNLVEIDIIRVYTAHSDQYILSLLKEKHDFEWQCMW